MNVISSCGQNAKQHIADTLSGGLSCHSRHLDNAAHPGMRLVSMGRRAAATPQLPPRGCVAWASLILVAALVEPSFLFFGAVNYSRSKLLFRIASRPIFRASVGWDQKLARAIQGSPLM